ncbi:MAG: neuromedin U, partial [bacterium]|nr:neuromedin U [bacterium]
GCLTAGHAAAQGDDLSAKTQNPIGSLISLPFKLTVDFEAPDGTAVVLNIQPVYPVTVGKWNLINRVIAPLAHVPGLVEGLPGLPQGGGDGSATGLGDINYSLFVSPAEAGRIIWGVGPSVMLPTATDDQLGSGKWSAGPTAVALVQPKPWSIGVLGRQLWSFAGDSDRSKVSQFLVEPFVTYNLDKGWYVTSDMVMT